MDSVFFGKCCVLVSRIIHATFARARYLCCDILRKRSEQFFSGYEDNVVLNACGKTKSCFTPFLCKCTCTHPCGRVHTRTLSRTNLRTLVLFLYFHWRRVSQKSTFNGKRLVFNGNRLVFLRTRIHRGTRDRTSERTHTGNVRIGTCVKGPCFARKLRIAQLRILTISGHVIAVSAQQRDNE